MLRRAQLGCLLLVLALASPLAASAQDADALIEQGIQLRERRRDAEALERFERAYELGHEARALAQIALAEQALSRWVSAYRHLQQALEAADDWVEQRAALLRQALSAIEPHVGRLSVTGSPPGAVVHVDGLPVGTLPLETVVEPGSHVVEVGAAGYRPHRVEVSVAEGWHAEEAVTLEAEASGDDDAEPPAGAPAGGTSIHPAGPVVLGVGGALVIAGIVTGVLVLDLDGQISSMCPDPSRCPASVRSVASDRATFAALTDVFLFTGGAAAVAGLIMTLLLTEESPGDVAIRPAMDGRGAGLVVEGAF